MPHTVPLPRVRQDDSPAQPAPTARIGDNVLRALGRPADLFRMQVRGLWGDFYRANVFVGDAAACKVAHSYFLEATAAGEIVTSSPAIGRAY
jgi:hypothetical protein